MSLQLVLILASFHPAVVFAAIVPLNKEPISRRSSYGAQTLGRDDLY